MHIASDVSLAELATTVPGAARVLERHRLDFCCRGERTLADACADRALPAAALVDELRAAVPSDDDLAPWAEAPLDVLIEHILARYHAPLREELPRLVALAEKVERRHADKADCPRGVAAHLAAMADALEEHLQKEERILFPLIGAGRGAAAGMPIRVMQDEHLDHAANLDRLRALAHDFVAPDAACASWRALYLGLATLESDLHAHIALENHVLFPRSLRG
jgi:regulator of cell morphogenesis and NO signaling